MGHVHDVTFLTMDSVQEGIGQSQVGQVVSELARSGLDIALVSMEKTPPSRMLRSEFEDNAVPWTPLAFGGPGPRGSADRVRRLAGQAPPARLFHCRSDLPVGAALLRRTPFVWDVRSLWADQRVALGALAPGGPQYRLMRQFERAGYKRCSGMSTLTHSVIPELERRYGSRSRPSIVVPTCANLTTFHPSPAPPGPEIRILLSGTYNDYYDLDLMADLVALLRERTAVKVTWARPHESPREAIPFVDETVEPSSPAELSALIQQSHLGLSVCRADAGPSLTAAMPTKIGEFLACGRPVVVNPGLGDCDRFVSAGALASVARQSLMADADHLMTMLASNGLSERCRAVAETNFSLDRGCGKLLDLYSELASS